MKIEIANLRKSYLQDRVETKVLKGIDLVIESGDLTVIYGSSGAGKSTLLHILGTIENPSSGEVLYNGQSLQDFDDKSLSLFRNQNIGFIFQFHHLLPDFNILENVMIPLMIGGLKKNESKKKALYWLGQVGLEDKINSKPSGLSGGEQQRVAIARALVNEPSLILADEPTGNLDIENSKKIFELLLKMNKELRSTLLMVTHNQDLTKDFKHQVFLVDGKISQKN